MCRVCSHKDLTAFTLGEIGGWRAIRIQRHLDSCPLCRAEWQSVLQIAGLARTLQNQEVSDVMSTQLWSAITTALESLEGPARRRPWLTPRLALSAILLMVFAGVGLLTWRRYQAHQPDVILAQVKWAMRAAKTVHYHESRFWIDSKGEKLLEADDDCWINWQPMQLCTRTSREVVLTNEQGSTQYSLQAGTSKSTWKRSPLGRVRLRDLMLDEITVAIRPKTCSVQEIVMGSRKVLQFQEFYSAANRDTSDLYTVWADPDTLRVIRAEHRQYNIARKATYSEIREAFRYNETPPPFTFRLPASDPPGAKP